MKKILSFLLLLVCLFFAGCLQNLSRVGSSKDLTIFIFDNSGSMLLKDNASKKKKIDSAKANVENMLKSLNLASSEIALMKFGSNCNETVIDVAPTSDTKGFLKHLKRIKADNLNSSLSNAIVDAVNLGSNARNLNLIIITDGAESCSGNPVKAMQNAVSSHPRTNINTFVIGYNSSNSSAKKLKSLTTGKGRYFKASETAAIAEAIKNL